MATYEELLKASEDGLLNKRVRVACIIAAEDIRSENIATANHANRLTWAKGVFTNPNTEAQRMLWSVLAQNKSASLAAILAAGDNAVQSAVNAAVDVFATGA